VKTPYGYHIFKLEEVRRRKVLPFKQVKDRIKGELQQEKQKECLARWLAEARKRARIEIYREKLTPLEAKP